MKRQELTTADAIKAACVTTVKDLLNLPEWDSFRGSKLGNDLFINDPERAARCHDAAADGCDGSTHAEVIEDWREFAAEHYREVENATWSLDIADSEVTALENFVTEARAKLDADITRCEQWHEQNGSLHQQIG